MAKEVEKYFVKRLQTYLLEYLNDFSQNNVAKFSLGISSNIRLENLSIKKQALLNFSLPMYIIDGKISAITVNMPLNYKAQQSEMIIEGIDLTVCAISETSILGWNKQANISGDENLKKHKLKIWEEQMSKYFEQLSPPSWIQKIVDGIYNNMSISVKQFNLRFQNYSIFGFETVLRIKADFSIKATDSSYQQRFNSDLKCSFKQVDIKKLSVSLKGANFKSSSNKKDDQYILYPIDINIRLCINLDRESQAKPLNDVQVRVDSPIIMSINKDQKNYLLKLNELIKNLEIIQDNYHLRPLCEVKSNYGEWWKYLINAIIQNQKNHKLDLGHSSHRLVLMKRYIELYKRKQNIILVPWLSAWSPKDEPKFQHCERFLSLKDLLKYREWAFEEIRIEAKRYFHSSKDGQHKKGVKPILEIWTNTINNQNSFKGHQKDQDDDIPIELEDDEKINLYEILERDKTRVLSSFLKGQNNDPDQIKLQLQVEIHSIFILIIENRVQSQILYSERNMKMFQNCYCSKCCNKRFKSGTIDQSKKSMRATLDKSHIIDAFNDKQFQNKDDLSFHTAKAEDSFLSDLNDLNENKQYVSESVENEPQGKNSHQQISEAQRKPRIILMISMIGIGCQLQIFLNNRIKTAQNSPIFIADLRLLSLGMVPTLLAEKAASYNQQDANQMKKKYCEFIGEIFDISIQKEQVFLNSEACFLNLMEFLNQNELSKLSKFLIQFERDKNCFQDFIAKNFDQTYEVFFNEQEDDEFFLHLFPPPSKEERSHTESKQQKVKVVWQTVKQVSVNQEVNKSLQMWRKQTNKHQYLQEYHARIIDLIRKYLFVPFLEEYGEQILPLCIQNLKDKFGIQGLSLNATPAKLDAIRHKNSIEFTISVEGDKSDYEIRPLNHEALSKSKKSNKTMIQSTFDQRQYTLKIAPFQCFLTTKSIASLLDFMEPLNQNQLSQGQLFVTENHKLLECILKSKPIGRDKGFPPKPSFEITIEPKFKVRLLSDQISNIIRTELQIKIKHLQAHTISTSQLVNKIPNNNSLEKEHKYYDHIVLQIEKIQLEHKFYSPDIVDQPSIVEIGDLQSSKRDRPQPKEGQSQKRKILTTQLKMLWMDSQIKNHLLLTDQKIYIQIPYLNIEITDSAICLTELLTILGKRSSESDPPHQNSFIMSHDSLLRAELLTLYKDHKHEECKHCILKYKKSIKITNIVLGQIPSSQLNNEYQATWFTVLQQLKREVKNNENGLRQNATGSKNNRSDLKRPNPGLQITFLCMNRFAIKSQNSTIIQVPVIAFTRDEGFFKDIITLHCSGSTVLHQGSLVVVQSAARQEEVKNQSQRELKEMNETTETNYLLIQPLYEVDPQEVWRKLDDKFIFYCRKLEETIFTSNFDLNQEAEFDREIRQEEFGSPNQEKLYLLAYYHKPLRKQLIMEQEKVVKQKSLKTRIYFQLQKVWARFVDQYAACTIMTTMKSINYIANILDNIYNLLYQDIFKQAKSAKTGFDRQNPIKALEDTMINIYVQSLYFQSSKSYFRLNSMRMMYNIDIPNEETYVQSELYKRSSIQMVNQNDTGSFQRNRNTINTMIGKPHESSHSGDGEMVMRCASIVLNLSKFEPNMNGSGSPQRRIKESIIEVKLLNLKKKSKNEVILTVDNIQIVIQLKEDQRFSKEVILMMPDKQNKQMSKSLMAIKVNLSFLNANPFLQLQVESARIQLQVLSIENLLQAFNSLYLIDIQESVALTNHLKTMIFKSELHCRGKDAQTVDLFKKQSSQSDSKNSKKDLNYTINLMMDQLMITLQEKGRNFFNVSFQQIEMEQKRGQDMQLKLQSLQLEPQEDQSQEKKNNNLVLSCSEQHKLSIKLEGRTVFVENMNFIFISKYINELKAFKKKVNKILQDGRDELYRYQQQDANQLLKLEEYKQDLVMSKPFKLLLRNSQILVPEFSTSKDFVQFSFKTCNVTIEKKCKSMKFPNINQPKSLENIVIDYDGKADFGDVYMDIMNISLNDLQAQYFIQKHQSQEELMSFFNSAQLDITMMLPYFHAPPMNWEMKDQINVQVGQLQMEMDFGRMMLVRKLVESNLKEPSQLFEFEADRLQKINFNLQIDSMSMSSQSFTQSEQKEHQVPNMKSKAYSREVSLKKQSSVPEQMSQRQNMQQ